MDIYINPPNAYALSNGEKSLLKDASLEDPDNGKVAFIDLIDDKTLIIKDAYLLHLTLLVPKAAFLQSKGNAIGETERKLALEL